MDSNSKHARDFVSKIDPHQPINRFVYATPPTPLCYPDLPFDLTRSKSLSGIIYIHILISCDEDRERTHNNKPLHFVHSFLIVIVVIRFVVLERKKNRPLRSFNLRNMVFQDIVTVLLW